MEIEEFVVSRYEERFSGEFYPSREVAIANAANDLGLSIGESFFVGRVKHVEAPLIDVDDVAESLWEKVIGDVESQMADEAGESAEGYPRDNFGAGIKQEVCEKIAALLSETLPVPSFYLVVDVRSSEVK